MSSRLPSIFPSTPAVIRATGRWTRGWGGAQTRGRRGTPQPAGDASAGRMPWGLCRSECSGHLGLEGAGAGKQGVPRGARLPHWAVTLVSCWSVEAAFERVGPGPQSTPLLPSPWDRRVQRGPRNWESGQRGEGRAQGHPTNQAPGPAPSAPKASSWRPSSRPHPRSIFPSTSHSERRPWSPAGPHVVAHGGCGPAPARPPAAVWRLPSLHRGRTQSWLSRPESGKRRGQTRA